MVEGAATYVAWDGKRYAGEPPTGWFLAADNRWWPNKTLVDAEQGPSSASSRRVATAPPPPLDQTQNPPASAPRNNQSQRLQPPGQPPPPRYQQPPAPGRGGARTPGARTRQHTKRNRNSTIKRVFFGVGLLWFLFSIGAAFSSSADPNGGEIASPAVETTVRGPATAQATPTAAGDAPPTTPTNFTSNDIDFRATGCGPGVITGMLSTQRSDAESIELAFEVLVDSDPPLTATVTRSYGRLEPDQAQPMMAPLPDDITTFDCEIVSVTMTSSSIQG